MMTIYNTPIKTKELPAPVHFRNNNCQKNFVLPFFLKKKKIQWLKLRGKVIPDKQQLQNWINFTLRIIKKNY